MPFIAISPRKCANLMNVGSILIISSFALLKGPYKFLIHELLFNKDKWFFAWLYVVSLVATMYSAMSLKSYILTLVSLGTEIICLLYFVSSYFPGGPEGMKMMLNSGWTMFKSALGCLVGRGQNPA